MAAHPALLNADVATLPVRDGAFDVVLAEDVRQDVQTVIDHDGAFITSGDLAAFVCR